MNVEEIQKKIFTDENFVLSEICKISLYYQLKHTIRWAHERGQDETESVAEHIYALHIIKDYFLPLVDERKTMNPELICDLITWHDMAEAVVSDMTTRSKTDTHKMAEKEAEKNLVTEATPHLQEKLTTVFETYNKQELPEANFVKALDKLEPLFHLFFLSTKDTVSSSHFDLGWTTEEYRLHRKPFVEKYKIIQRFDDVLTTHTAHFHPK